MRYIACLIFLMLLSLPLQAQPTGPAFAIRAGANLPATCQPAGSNVFFKTTATVGLYVCTATNTWTLVVAGSSGIGGSISINQVAFADGTDSITGTSDLTYDGHDIFNYLGDAFVLGTTSGSAVFDVNNSGGLWLTGNSPTYNNYGASGGAGIGGRAQLYNRTIRGTFASPLKVEDGDTILRFFAQGGNGSSPSFSDQSMLSFVVDGATTNGQNPGSAFEFWTNSNNASTALNLRLRGNGDLQTMHILGMGTAPSVASTSANSCGTSPPSIAGADIGGRVTVGATSGTSCTITFGTAFATAPACVAQNETTANIIKPTASTTTLIVAGTFVAGDKLVYNCIAY